MIELDISVYSRVDTKAFNICFSRGSLVIGSAGNSTYTELYGRDYFLYMDENNLGHLYRFDFESTNSWVEVTGLLPVFTGEHPSLAFATDSNPVIAYQSGTTINYIRNNLGSFVIDGSFTGVDPVVFSDSELTKNFIDPDVYIFYLDVARTEIRYRIGRENFTIERTWTTLINGGGTNGLFLDNKHIKENTFQLRLRDSNNNKYAITSNLYPTFAREILNVNSNLLNFTYEASQSDVLEINNMIANSTLIQFSLDASISLEPETNNMIANSLLIAFSLEATILLEPETNNMIANITLQNFNYTNSLIPEFETNDMVANSILRDFQYRQTI